jgi:hypothetical protein
VVIVRLAATDDPDSQYVIMILPESVTISSIENNTTDDTATYDNATDAVAAEEIP